MKQVKVNSLIENINLVVKTLLLILFIFKLVHYFNPTLLTLFFLNKKKT